MIISSNHYCDLDPALIRPGRIDLTLELSYATHEIIREMYMHIFKENMDINDEKLIRITDKFYSPAEIMNIYMNEGRNKDCFMNRLLKNEHV
jgi:ATP-dependent 26S proteasome regulatory subunit